MSLAKTQKRTAEAFINGYNDWTVEALLRARSEDCVHAIIPASMGRPERSNKEYGEFFETLQGVVSGFRMEIEKIVLDSEQGVAVVHAKGYGETPIVPYRNEYAFFLYFTEDGSKVRRVEEFVDSAFSGNFFAKMQELSEAQEGR